MTVILWHTADWPCNFFFSFLFTNTDLEHVLLAFPRPTYSLATTFRHCSNWIQDENRRKLIAYQIFTHLHTLHSQGIVHNSLSAESIFVDETGWVLTTMPLSRHSTRIPNPSWQCKPWEPAANSLLLPEKELAQQGSECDATQSECQSTYQERYPMMHIYKYEFSFLVWGAWSRNRDYSQGYRICLC